MGQQDSINGECADRCKEDFVEDSGKVIILCSNCNAKLVEIWRTKPNVKIKTTVTAKCGICGDKSFAKVIRGGFHMAPVENGLVNLIDTKQGDAVQDGDDILMTLTIVTEKR